MYRICKRFEFSASHALAHLGDSHPCSRTHGHNYRVDVEIEGEIDNKGMVLDYREFKPFGDELQATFDHRHLNEVMEDIVPTAENIARTIYLVAIKTLHPERGRVVSVRVSETDRTWAEYRP